MKLVDTHCHLHFPDYDADRADVVLRAQKAGVGYLVNVGTDKATNEAAWTLAASYPGVMSHTAGLHPHHAHEIAADEIENIEAFIQRTKPVAIGEIGLDYYKSAGEASIQKSIFRRMLALAQQYDLPVIIHSRNAFDDTYEMLVSEDQGRLRGVMHCYSYDRESLKKLLDIGFMASFTATLTYKKTEDIIDAASYAPSDRILLETDSPYLAPQAFRGKRNEPAFLTELALFLAQKRGVSVEDLADQTTQNASRFFGIALT
jgi:TatD DNase family protein